MDYFAINDTMKEALEKARHAIESMTGVPVTLRSTSAKLVSPEELPFLSAGPEWPVVAAYVCFQGDCSGHALVMFDIASAQRVVSEVLGPEHADPELATSLITEIGNVTCSALVNTIADHTGACITPTPPDFAQDMGGAMLESLAVSMIGWIDEVLVFCTEFSVFNDHNKGRLLYMPEKQSLRLLMEGVGGMR